MTETASFQVLDSIAQLDEAQWTACFPGELEGWRYYRAVEKAGVPGFTLKILALLGQDGRLLAAVPAFLTRYDLDTTLQGGLKRVSSGLKRLFPGLISLKLACLGSPVAECCHIGFAPTLGEEDRHALLAQLLAGFEAWAAEQGIGLFGLKDITEAERPLWESVAGEYQRLPSLPIAWLAVPPGGIDAYLSSLSRATRKDMKRKLRSRDDLEIEWRAEIDDVLPEIMELYRATRSASELQFEELTEDFFREVLAAMPGEASCVLYRHQGVLAAFNLVLHNEGRLIDKFVGLKPGLARDHNLYFVSWFENLRFCAERSIPIYHSGQAEYGPKVRLGCTLSPTWMLFRHRRPMVNRLLRLVGDLVRLDRFDDNIKDEAA